MATTTEIADRIERDLYALHAELEWLPNTVAEWDETADWERASISLDWDHLLCDYLGELQRFWHDRAMTADQEVRYQDLVRRLRDAMPLFDRLGLLPLPVKSDT